MDEKGKKGKGNDDSAPPPPRKGGLKFTPKVSRKKALEIVPKMEPQEDSKIQTIDKDLMMKLKTSQSTDALERRAKAEKKKKPVSRLHLENLDEDEFGEFSFSRDQDGELTAAEELGLMDTEDMMNNPQLLFFQLPAFLPLPMQVESVAEADTDTSEDVETEGTKSKENDKKRRHQPIHGCKLKDLPGGLMGKVLVYKSGKVKMRLRDALFDVSAGLNCAFAQEAVAINIKKKHCCSLGEVSKHAIVTPDIDEKMEY